ncbi:hypothetical protein GMRT_15105 [Giardia muris]|uniref:Uncharacterized protein n=1 Tax=Giardia muris TaxID=5742 RepID=A0A4Z1T339_GIAMU|nr:hypothetical protein GMRT_15105 [Giardia muris]|eukprot:TNJ26979.1 hypothetical protein GMRT_15105 [Giardia muris]
MRIFNHSGTPRLIGPAHVVCLTAEFIFGDACCLIHLSNDTVQVYLLVEDGQHRLLGEINDCDAFATYQCGEKETLLVGVIGQTLKAYRLIFTGTSLNIIFILAISLPETISYAASDAHVVAVASPKNLYLYSTHAILNGVVPRPIIVGLNEHTITDVVLNRDRPGELLTANENSELVFIDATLPEQQLREGMGMDEAESLFLFGSAYPFSLGSIAYATSMLVLSTGSMGLVLVDPEDGSIVRQIMDCSTLAKGYSKILTVQAGQDPIVTCTRDCGDVSIFRYVRDGVKERLERLCFFPAMRLVSNPSSDEVITIPRVALLSPTGKQGLVLNMSGYLQLYTLATE